MYAFSYLVDRHTYDGQLSTFRQQGSREHALHQLLGLPRGGPQEDGGTHRHSTLEDPAVLLVPKTPVLVPIRT